MNQPADILEHYERLVAGLLPSTNLSEGLPWPDRIAPVKLGPHTRREYCGLLIRTMTLWPESTTTAMPAHLQTELRSAGTALQNNAAQLSPETSVAWAWDALSLESWVDQTGTAEDARSESPVWPAIRAAQQPAGNFFVVDSHASPEVRWYQELAMLQAMASHDVCWRGKILSPESSRNALYHLEETQPDHATTQPWGLLAFILHPQTLSLADQMLHSVQTQRPHVNDPATLMLLADTLYSLRQVIRRG